MSQTHNEPASFTRMHNTCVSNIPWLSSEDTQLQEMLNDLLIDAMAFVRDHLDDGTYTLPELRNLLDKSNEAEARLWFYLGVLLDICQAADVTAGDCSRMYCLLNGSMMKIMTPSLCAIEWDIIKSKVPDNSIIGMTDLSSVLDPLSSILITDYDVSPMDAGEAPVLWSAEKCESPKQALADFNALRARNGSPHIYAPYGHPAY